VTSETETPASAPATERDDERRPRLHVLVLSHLDTQWRWTVRDTVRRFLPRTVSENDELFRRWARFTLSFEGAYRYRLLARHHPELFDVVRARAAEGRWHPAGAAVEAFDTLLPSPESILRQIHLGQRWFASHLGRESADLFLPDCFGFPATLPTLARHAGLVGFSTQKLRRGDLLRATRPIPFPYGRWRGPDGAELLAALDPGEYSGRIEGDLSADEGWRRRFEALRRNGRPRRLLFYVGTGDRGGAPPESSIAALESSLAADGPIEVRHGPSDSIYRETTGAERERLPVHDGELLLRLHGTGCYTARAEMKRANRRNERLAREAEAAAALASTLGHEAPRRRLEEAWWRVLAHQMHDDLTGTAIPAAYRISLTEEELSAADFEQVLTAAVDRIAESLDRNGEGIPLLIVNALGREREDLVEVALRPGDAAGPWVAIAPDGGRSPVQTGRDAGGRPTALFAVRVPALSVTVHRLTTGDTVPAGDAKARPTELENERYRAGFDRDGNLASLEDKRLGRELLAEPIRVELFADRSRKYPAWEILWEDLARGPLRRLDGRVGRVVEEGPVRAALEIERAGAGARIVERWSLAAGAAGDRVECAVTCHWRARSGLLKARFRFDLDAAQAAYDTGLGTIRRPVSSPALYEVPAQLWAALEDGERDAGAAVLSDVRAGWDHPDASTLRQTWIHAPRASFKWRHQRTQDRGSHRFRIGLAGFRGAAGAATAALAERFAHPLRVFRARPGGPPGGELSLAPLELAGAALLQACKPADDSDRLVLRFRNPGADAAVAAVRARGAPLEAVAMDGRERELEAPSTAGRDGVVELPVPAAGLGTIGLRLGADRRAPAADFLDLPLPGDVPLVTHRRQRRSDGGFDGHGLAFPAEELPQRIDDAPAPFSIPTAGGSRSAALVPRGQTLELPAGWAELWLLAAAVAGDLEAVFGVRGEAVAVRIPDWRRPERWSPAATPAGPWLAWSAPYLRDRRGGDRVAEPAALWALRFELRGAGGGFRLPDAAGLRIVAATLARTPRRLVEDAAPAD
jgi:alpha-mannosidase